MDDYDSRHYECWKPTKMDRASFLYAIESATIPHHQFPGTVCLDPQIFGARGTWERRSFQRWWHRYEYVPDAVYLQLIKEHNVPVGGHNPANVDQG